MWDACLHIYKGQTAGAMGNRRETGMSASKTKGFGYWNYESLIEIGQSLCKIEHRVLCSIERMHMEGVQWGFRRLIPCLQHVEGLTRLGLYSSQLKRMTVICKQLNADVSLIEDMRAKRHSLRIKGWATTEGDMETILHAEEGPPLEFCNLKDCGGHYVHSKCGLIWREWRDTVMVLENGLLWSWKNERSGAKHHMAYSCFLWTKAGNWLSVGC